MQLSSRRIAPASQKRSYLISGYAGRVFFALFLAGEWHARERRHERIVMAIPTGNWVTVSLFKRNTCTCLRRIGAAETGNRVRLRELLADLTSTNLNRITQITMVAWKYILILCLVVGFKKPVSWLSAFDIEICGYSKKREENISAASSFLISLLPSSLWIAE